MNTNNKVVQDFGEEWQRFDFLNLKELDALREQYANYMKPLPKKVFASKSLVAADFGAGSGRWSYFLKNYCEKLYVLEPSEKAFAVCKARFDKDAKVILMNESIEQNSIPNDSLDLAISLGVLHHLSDTQSAIRSLSSKIKPGGYFCGYIYYKLENKPLYYRLIFHLSNLIRKSVSHFPTKMKFITADMFAVFFYFPLAKLSKLISKTGVSMTNFPLHHYAHLSFKVMRNDALDRFGTTLEGRFTSTEILQMLEVSGFDISTLVFSDDEPFWTFAVQKLP